MDEFLAKAWTEPSSKEHILVKAMTAVAVAAGITDAEGAIVEQKKAQIPTYLQTIGQLDEKEVKASRHWYPSFGRKAAKK
jgi:hypothetical protein